MQYSIFDMLYPKYKIKKPIRLIEFFAGYGSQALALKYLGIEFEHWKICEWAIKSIQAYKDIHFTNDNENYSVGLALEDLKDILFQYGISSNYNEPMSKKQIERLNENQLRTIFNNICATNDLVNIQQVKGKDLEIVDTDKYDYILTYSFPCQDLSLAGKGKGMSDTSTRSGMLWEVERILGECYELGALPQILLMENVPQVHGVDNVSDFNKWQLRLEELGYKNYFQDLIATDYGIPQTRNRCFMISILGDYSYSFPQPIPLELKLKDMLEENVDENYYLSDKMINYVLNRTPIGEKDNFANNILGNDSEKNAGTITTAGSNTGTSCRSGDNFIVDNMTQQEVNKKIYLKKDTENYIEWNEEGKLDIDCRASKEDKVSTTICTSPKNKVLIRNATKKGYLEAEEGDGIDISTRMEYHRGTVQKGKTQTLTTMGGENNGVLVSETLKRELCNQLVQNDLVEEGDVIKHAYASRIMNGEKKAVERNDGNMITLTTRCDCVGTTVKDNIGNLRIRKLTPRECFRLMGVKDEDYEKCAKNQSDSSLYHLAGDSIVVNVLMAIFKELF